MPKHVDILVVGGGTAGIAAACAAAQKGCSVVLVERYGFLGGLASSAEVGTICGLFYRSPSAHYVNHGFPRRFSEALALRSGTAPQRFAKDLWFLPHKPVDVRFVADTFVRRAGVHILFHTMLISVEEKSNKIGPITLFSWDRLIRVEASAIVDCSGEAVVATALSHPLVESSAYQAGAIVFRLDQLPSIEESLLNKLLLREVAYGCASGVLTKAHQHLSVVPGSVHDNSARCKLSLPNAAHCDPERARALEPEARSLVDSLITFLQRKESACNAVRLSEYATQVGIRTGPRPACAHVLDEKDVLSPIHRPDSIARAAWPIELWGSARQPEMRYLSHDHYYDIPLQTLCSPLYSNLFFSGRALSATEEAIASARVIGTCLATGFAAGSLAAGVLGKESEVKICAELRSHFEWE